MGQELCCATKNNELGSDFIFESVANSKIIVKLDLNDNKELMFDQLYEKIKFSDENIKNKLRDLSKFVYDTRENIKDLEIVESDQSIPEETYYGFM